ncbi:ABC transporter substrate-binding protein [Tianweitania populi]|uniref:ABC transporter substrate-binding protein n=2 Tax=Tianweitania populi TaxID=1607949 RepID=A0A8J3DV60_9HYPH|nr:ABC transporter substrate-binding protein [Tianweitania populi]
MQGKPALAADFQHMPYANPDAPKGGRVVYAWQGSFDSLNPFIVQGDGARGLFDTDFGNNVFESLMLRSRDEAFTMYPLIAESVETDDNRTFVTFTLNPNAKFSDGQPVTVDDVIFSLELFRDKARPIYQRWVGVIDRMERVGERGLKLVFNDKADRESPLLLAGIPILPKHAVDRETFDRTSLKPMIGSGPYIIDNVRPGEQVTLKRNPEYWAKDLPTKRGFDNYDEIRITYFRDPNTMFEAFKKGLVDVFLEDQTGRWATGYNFPAVSDGRVRKETFDKQTPADMLGFVLNTRRPVFQNRDVRRALAGLFDFEWSNRNLFNDAYQRTTSYFDGSELSSTGRPASEVEKNLLAPYSDAVRPDILAGTWTPPKSDGSGRDREFLRQGFEALKAAGYAMKNGRMVDASGTPLAFEILLNGKSSEQISMAWQGTLARLGISVTVRSVDAAQYLQRQRTYDFDAMLMRYTSSLSPGVEQQFRWGSASARAPGTYNFAGVAEPAIDGLINKMVNARDRDEFVTIVRAYDRVLLSGAYIVPLYYQPQQWVASWSHIHRPEQTSVYGYQLPTWWSEGAAR